MSDTNPNQGKRIVIPASHLSQDIPRDLTISIKDHGNRTVMMFTPHHGNFVTEQNRSNYPQSRVGDQIFLMTDDSVRDKPVSWGMVKNILHATEQHCNMLYSEIIENSTGLVNNRIWKEATA